MDIYLEIVTNNLGMEDVIIRKKTEILAIIPVYQFKILADDFKKKLKEFENTPLLKEFLKEHNTPMEKKKKKS